MCWPVSRSRCSKAVRQQVPCGKKSHPTEPGGPLAEAAAAAGLGAAHAGVVWTVSALGQTEGRVRTLRTAWARAGPPGETLRTAPGMGRGRHPTFFFFFSFFFFFRSGSSSFFFFFFL